MSQNVAENQLSAKQEKVAADVAADELTNEQIAKKRKITPRTLDRWKALPQFAARVAEIVEASRLAVRAKTIANKEHRVDALIDRQKRMQQVIVERAEWYERNKPDVPGGKTGLLVSSVKFVKVYEVDARRMRARIAEWKPKVGDEVRVLDEGLARLRRLVPDAPPNHFGVIEEIWDDGSLLILFDDTKQSAPYPGALVQPRHVEEAIYPTREVQPVDEHAVDVALLKEMRATEQQLAQELGEWTEKRQSSGSVANLDLSQLNDEQLNVYEQQLNAGVEPEQAYIRARQSKS